MPSPGYSPQQVLVIYIQLYYKVIAHLHCFAFLISLLVPL